MGVTRQGGLAEESLRAAIADEVSRGRAPYALVVGTPELQACALEILAPARGLERLMAVMPRVELDRGLGDSWEIRERLPSSSAAQVPTR